MHLDTDIGGDPDDVCALAMLLGWPDVEITGITTTHEEGGRRAGLRARGAAARGPSRHPRRRGRRALDDDARAARRLPRRRALLGTTDPADAAPGGSRARSPRREHRARRDRDRDRTVHEPRAASRSHGPGCSTRVPVVVMGGALPPARSRAIRSGPRTTTGTCSATRGPRRSSNGLARADGRAARRDGEGAPARRPPAAVAGCWSARRRSWPGRPRRTGVDRRAGLAEENPTLPADLLNFHHDPLAAAVAVGWDGVTIERPRPVESSPMSTAMRSPSGGSKRSSTYIRAGERPAPRQPVRVRSARDRARSRARRRARRARRRALAAPADQRRDAVAAVAARWPRYLDAWAQLGMLARDDTEAYACFRVGYHRGLDRLRANGWRGSGYVRWVVRGEPRLPPVAARPRPDRGPHRRGRRSRAVRALPRAVRPDGSASRGVARWHPQADDQQS